MVTQILVIDEDPAAADRLRALLPPDGLQLHHCAGIGQALTLLRDLAPAQVPEDSTIPAVVWGEVVRLGELAIDVEAHEVTRAGTPLALSPLEYRLLLTLARCPGRAFTRAELLETVWDRRPADDRIVNVTVQRLRSKVEPDPRHPAHVLTVRGVGYRAVAPTASVGL